MAHWAELDNDDVVVRVIVCDADDGADGAKHPPAFCTDVLGGRWVRTYYDSPGRTFAGIGFRHVGGGAQFKVPERVVDAPLEVLAADPEFQKLADRDKTLVERMVGRLVDARVTGKRR